jgi:hypothetical protein
MTAWLKSLFELGISIWEWSTAKTEDERARKRAEADKKYSDMFTFFEKGGEIDREKASNDMAADAILDERFPKTSPDDPT